MFCHWEHYFCVNFYRDFVGYNVFIIVYTVYVKTFEGENLTFDTRAGRMAEAEFETDSSVHGYHVYQDNWTPVIGERLHCER